MDSGQFSKDLEPVSPSRRKREERDRDEQGFVEKEAVMNSSPVEEDMSPRQRRLRDRMLKAKSAKEDDDARALEARTQPAGDDAPPPGRTRSRKT